MFFLLQHGVDCGFFKIKRILTMTHGHFIIKTENEEKNISPEEYGYWLFQWSIDEARASLENLNDEKYNISPLVKEFHANNFWAHAQFIAIYVASYVFYAIEFQGVPIDGQDRMKVGTDNAIKELKGINTVQAQYLKGSISAYLQANIEDFADSKFAEPGVFRPDFSKLASKFFELITRLYPNIKITEIDRLVLGHLVANTPIHLYQALHEIQTRYVK